MKALLINVAGRAKKLFQDDQEARLVWNTTDSQDQTINTKRGTLSLSKWVLKLLQRAFRRQISKLGHQKDIGEWITASETDWNLNRLKIKEML